MTDALSPELASFTAGSPAARADEITAESEGVRRVLAEAQRVVVGQDILLERLLLGLLADGHILLEGLPGLAKTLAVKTIATTIEADCSRVQFTPDLLPTDLIGTMIYNQRTSEFSVQRGPIFTNILLADEINRAPAKVQSALLESMQERQVTIGGETLHLPNLFLVLATQNPIEQEGTYPLPEAQVDRFLFKLVVTYPARADERSMLDRMTDGTPPVARPVLHADDILRARKGVERIHVDGRIKEYVLDLVAATRRPGEAGLAQLAPLIAFGASPRAAIYLVRAAKAHAFLAGRAFVIPEDVKSVATDVLRHRIVPTYRADADNVTTDQMVDRILGQIAVPMITDEIADEVRRLELATRRLVRDLSAGDYASAFRGRGIEFQDVREYQPGDDVRTIDWRVTARLGVTYLRRHHEERELTVLLLVDESASAQVGSRRRTRSELAAQVAAVLALTAAHANDRVGAAFFSDGLSRMVAPRKGRRHALRVLGELLAARADGATTDLGAALDAIEPLLPRRVVLVILSDFYTSGYQLPLSRLARKHEIICMQLRDSIEQALPAVGLIRLRDPESGSIVTVDASSAAVREWVAERRARFEETLAHDLYASGAELVRLDASGDFAEPLVAFFRRRARR